MTSLSHFTFMHWSRKWQPTPVFLPGESQGWQSLVGCRLWGCTESDTTEATWQQQQQHRVGKTAWRRERLHTSVVWPGAFHGLYSPWGHKELDRLIDFHFHRLYECSLCCFIESIMISSLYFYDQFLIQEIKYISGARINSLSPRPWSSTWPRRCATASCCASCCTTSPPAPSTSRTSTSGRRCPR